MMQEQNQVDGVATMPPLSPLEAVLGVIRQPIPTLRQIALTRPWPLALGLTVVAALLGGLANLTAPPPSAADLAALDPDMRRVIESIYVSLSSPVTALVSGLIIAPIMLVIVAGILYLFGRMFGGRGPYSGLFSAYGFTSVPSLLAAPLTAVLNLGGAALAPLTGLLGIGVAIWQLVLAVIAVRESLTMTTGRAVATVLIPVGLLLLLACVLGIVIGILAAASMGGAAR